MKKLLSLLTTSAIAATAMFAQPAPNFTVTDAHGKVHNLYTDYLNKGKTVVLEIFFTTCPPCNSIAPKVQKLYTDWGSGLRDVQFIELSSWASDNDQNVRAYETTHGITYPGVSPQGGSMQAIVPYVNGTYGVFYGTPTFIVIGPTGTVYFDIRGAGQDGTIAALDRAIGATGATKPNQVFDLSGSVRTLKGRPIPNVKVWVEGFENQFDPTDTEGNFSISLQLQPGITYNLLASKPDSFPLGITTLDLVIVSKHILNVTKLTTNAEVIAADINNSRTVTTLDLVPMKKLILYIQRTLPGVASPWVFMPQAFGLAPNGDMTHVNALTFNTSSNLEALNVVGVKLGDLNDSVILR
jgi:thiol-disulfide isomerase/thioredoxin